MEIIPTADIFNIYESLTFYMQKFLLSLLLLIFAHTAAYGQRDSTRSTNTPEERASYYLNRLQEEYGQGNYTDHKTYSDSLYTISKEHGLVKNQILAMVNQAVFYNNRSEQHQSISLYRDALELCREIPDDYKVKTVVLVNMGNTYADIDAHEKAIEAMEVVLSIADTAANSTRIKAAALTGLSNNYSKLENYEKALEYAYQSKALAKELQNEQVLTTALSNISDLYYENGEYEKAIATGEMALKLAFVKKPVEQRAWILLGLGVSNDKLDNLDKALTYLKEAKEIAIAIEIIELEMHCEEHLAEIYKRQRKFKESTEAQTRYIAIKNELERNKKDAIKIDLEKDLSSKDNIINSNLSQLNIAKQKRKNWLFFGGFIAILLTALLFSLVLQKKKQEQENKLLREEFIAFKSGQVVPSDTQKDTEGQEKVTNTRYKNSSLKPEDHKTYKKLLLTVMEEERPYLDYNLKSTDLATKLGISSHHLSEVLRFGFDQNFYNFINPYRVKEAQRLMELPKYKNVKILAIALDSGFKSKTSFNRIFKKHTGSTPSDYRRKINLK
ncbi:AraC family transcriptional regulator [uncultured Croceitalea sp.]|uniref:AraC family transcriptional regulator n=1 Tax=uncultured Croceitalea sp. TaxID=1798908 RepID=UPI0033060270